MNLLRLKGTGKKLIRFASRGEVQDYFIRLPNRERRRKWLRLGNRYRSECTRLYSRDLAAGTVDHHQLADYIAASGPTHAIDGWSLLGRAIDSSLRGDAYSAVHFAYYAELRAGMALLACEGVGIFNNRHPAIEPTGQTSPLPKSEIWNPSTKKFDDRWVGTHAIIWPCLYHWSTLKRAAGLFDELIKPRGLPLSGWLQECGATVPARAIGQAWLKAWGLDIAVLDEDHNARNLASYRPSEFRLPPSLSVAERVKFVEELWRLFEPSEGTRFSVLERYLLRRALHLAKLTAVPSTTLERLGFQPLEAQDWANFLSRTDYPIPLIEADKDSPIQDARCHLQVIARAALLLYLAACAANRLLRNANYTTLDISHWWRRFGEARGLWPDDKIPTNPLDTWADIQSSLDEARVWRDRNQAAPGSSLRTWRRAQPSVVDDLGSCEMIAVWGLRP
jgi:hypothetical protein